MSRKCLVIPVFWINRSWRKRQKLAGCEAGNPIYSFEVKPFDSLPIDAVSLLEALLPPRSNDSEKAACLLKLFKMTLPSEDDL